MFWLLIQHEDDTALCISEMEMAEYQQIAVGVGLGVCLSDLSRCKCPAMIRPSLLSPHASVNINLFLLPCPLFSFLLLLPCLPQTFPFLPCLHFLSPASSFFAPWKTPFAVFIPLIWYSRTGPTARRSSDVHYLACFQYLQFYSDFSSSISASAWSVHLNSQNIYFWHSPLQQCLIVCEGVINSLIFWSNKGVRFMSFLVNLK